VEIPTRTDDPFLPAPKLPASKRSPALIFFIMLMDVIGITILYPVTAFIVQGYGGDALMVTMMTALYAAAQFFAAPLLGKLGDHYGRRPVLLYSLLGSAVGYLMFGFGGALWVLLLSRLIDGFSGGNMSVASAYIADISQPDERAKNFSLIGVAWGVGLILGPALGSATGQISLQAPALIAAGLSFLSLILGFFLLHESLPKEQRETAPIRPVDINPFASIGAMARKPRLGLLLLVLCLFNFAFNGINSTQTLFVIDRFDAQPWQVGLLLTLIGIVVIVVQVLLVGRVVPRYGEKPVAIASLLGQATLSVAIFFVPGFWLVLALSVLSSMVSAFTFPTMTTLTSNTVEPREQGVLMGVTTALNSLMTILSPLSAGVAYDRIMVGAPYWMGAVPFVLAAFLLMRSPVGER
jgi:DHA1 family tetracycline resistance protein-like MFS transporter